MAMVILGFQTNILIAQLCILYLNFVEIVSRDLRGVIPPRQRTQFKLVGGKIAITINEEEYSRSLAQFCYCLIGKLVLLKGDKPIMTKELKIKVSTI